MSEESRLLEVMKELGVMPDVPDLRDFENLLFFEFNLDFNVFLLFSLFGDGVSLLYTSLFIMTRGSDSFDTPIFYSLLY